MISVKECVPNIWGEAGIARVQRTRVTLGLAVAKRNVAKSREAEQALDLETSKRDIDWCMLSEKVAYEGRGCPQKCGEIWNGWNSYRGLIQGDLDLVGKDGENLSENPRETDNK
ncbi:hypothetical protein NDU88_008982 [Pleurodeles waltl]|uniref:Uncharacterized protein n=1 Tax=Pleurodeles waltl TaxID=8319 RepID=A0AAV7PTD6_PLEWA|nr:hypothetical protein NDU88_008982 [Pleurodeles waltl]